MGAPGTRVPGFAIGASTDTEWRTVVPQVRALPGSCGAEVLAFSLDAVTRAGRKCLQDALDEHLLLVIRDQSLSFDDQVKLTAIFGAVDERVHRRDAPFRHPEDARIHVVSNDRRGPTQTAATVFWHIDQSFRRHPPPVVVLRAVIVPPKGGVTMFADLRAAYRALSLQEKQEVDGLKARHRFGALVGVPGTAASPRALKPLVRVHPVTRQRALYLNQFCIESIEGLQPDRSAEFLRQLYAHSLKPEFIYTHHWVPGDVLVWDNASLMHRVADMPAAPRVLHRTQTRSRKSGYTRATDASAR